MFALRGIAVSLTFFVLLYCLLSALVAVSWRWLKLLHAAEQSVADLLFVLRVLPLFVSILITAAFVVPSFDILEPRSVDEGMGRLPLALGAAALLLIAYGFYRVIAAQVRTSRIVAAGSKVRARLKPARKPRLLLSRSRRETPPLTLVGMREPRSAGVRIRGCAPRSGRATRGAQSRARAHPFMGQPEEAGISFCAVPWADQARSRVVTGSRAGRRRRCGFQPE